MHWTDLHIRNYLKLLDRAPMRLTKQSITLFFATVFFVLGGCHLDSLTGPIIVADVEDEFYIDIWEKLEPGKRSFQLKIETIEEENCLNYSIDFDFQKTGYSLEVSLNDILVPADCQPGDATAKALVNTGMLSPGYYDLLIGLRNTVLNEGQVLVSGDRYFLKSDKENGIIFLHKELMRVPEKAIWGYVVFEEGQDEQIAGDFIADLKEISTEGNYNNGYYGYFTISNSAEKISVTDRPSTFNIKSFIFQFEEDKEQLISLLTNYREDHPDNIRIKLVTYEGKEL